MKIQIYSDLHIEFEAFNPVDVGADIVVLAGDIHTKSRGVAWANTVFSAPVIYALGNHEYYGSHLDHTLRKMKEAAAQHVHVLENEVFICEQTRFLVATAWTDFSLTGDVMAASATAWEQMNDFKMIRVGDSFRRLRPFDLIERSKATYQWLVQELEKPFSGRTIVVTHHAPLPQGDIDHYPAHLDAAYCNDWRHLMENVDIWVYGHTHFCADLTVGRCRVVSNPKGYPREDTGFNPSFFVELT